MANKKVKTDYVSDVTNVIVDNIKINLARANIVEYSKNLEKDIDSIKKSVDKIKDNWDSPTATYYSGELSKRVMNIQTEQKAMNDNLKKFFANVMADYEKSEKSIKKNADLFK